MSNGTFVIVSLLSSGLLLYIHSIGAIFKVRFSNTLSVVPSLYLGVITLFSLVYLLTMVTLYINELAHHLHYFFLFSIAVTLYFSYRFKIAILNRNIIENCFIFCGTMLFILIFQFYPYENLTNNIPANNFIIDLPIDNVISLMFAESLLRGELLEFGDWLGSDRPPLFAGTILFFNVLNVLNVPLDKVYLFIGVAVQTIIVPVTSEFIASLSRRKLTVPEKLFISFVVISSPIFVHNVAFLWPKLFAAMFMMITVYLLFFQRLKTIGLAILISISMLLSFLSHGGSGFAILSIAFIYLVKMKKVGDLYYGVIMGTVFIVGYMPWIFYQKVVQPPGDRLIKWQILGQIDITPEGVGHVFVEKYKDFQYLDVPVRIFQSFKGQFLDGFTQIGNAKTFGHFADLFIELSFFKLPFSIGAPLIIALILLLFSKNKLFNTLMLIAFVNIIVWFTIPFMPVGSMHEGTYLLPIIIITACVYGIINLHYGKALLMVILIGSGIGSMVVMDWRRAGVLEYRDVYKMVDIANYYGGADYKKTKKTNISVLGSYLASDADVADFTLNAINGSAIYYMTGPDATGQRLEVYGNGELVLELVEEKLLRWTRLDMGRYDQLKIRVIDEGKDWGQWSAVFVSK